MMEIRKTVLAEGIPSIYAVSLAEAGGRPCCIAASEERDGETLLVDCETEEVFPLPGSPGGVMAFVPAAGESAVLSIESFFPVFDSAGARIVKTVLHRREGGISAERQILTQAPYVHRIALLQEEDGAYLAAGILCRRKARSDDWSMPGSMQIAPYRPDADQLTLETVYDGVFKHHAMQVRKNAAGHDDLYFGGTEGCFRTTRLKGSWVTERILDVPTSDIALLDLDGDGREELAVIEGFHGDSAAVFKEDGGGYRRALDLPAAFGHVLWAGTLLGAPALIVGCRAGRKELTLYRLRPGRGGSIEIAEQTQLDQGGAPAQIFVQEDRNMILATNHDTGELVKYSLS
nr:hypothetical protein [uncultured Oscillibacter sp.]